MKWVFKTALAALGLGALAAVYATKVERTRVQLDRYEVEIDAAGMQSTGLQPAGLPTDGLTILHLSDFHFRAHGAVQARKIARLLALLTNERYDVLVLTGDLVHDAAGFQVALALVERLSPRRAAFVCPGNHDYAEYSMWGVFGHTWRQSDAGSRLALADLGPAARKLVDFVWKVLRNELVRLPVAFNDVPGMLAELAARGVTPLVNRAVPLPVGEATVWFAGIDDALEGQADLAAALAGAPAGAPLVLLAHNPDVWLDPPRCAGRPGAVGTHARRPGAPARDRRDSHPGHASEAQPACRVVSPGDQPHVREPRPGRKHPAAIRGQTAGCVDPVGVSV